MLKIVIEEKIGFVSTSRKRKKKLNVLSKVLVGINRRSVDFINLVSRVNFDEG